MQSASYPQKILKYAKRLTSVILYTIKYIIQRIKNTRSKNKYLN